YRLWKGSGTSGIPGIFVQDPHALAVYDALVATRLVLPTPNARSRYVAAGGRSALIVATGDHFASISSWERIRRAFPGVPARSFSVLSPLSKLVRELNEYRPAFIASYPSLLAMLAREHVAGRLTV